MKAILKKTAIALLIVMIFNCNNDDNTINTEPDQLNRRVASFYTNSGTFNISYNQNSLIESIEVPSNTPVTKAIIYNSRDKITSSGSPLYQYNDAGEITSIVTENTEANLSYNSQGEIEKIITEKVNEDGSVSTSTANFIYNINGVISEIIENSTNYPTLTFRERFTYDTNLNLTQILEEETTDNINFVITATLTYTYDDKKHPYYDVNNVLNEFSNTSTYDLWNFHGPRLTRKSFQHLSHYGPNNYLTIKKVTATGASTIFNFENNYNTDNYLTLKNRTVTLPNGTERYAIYGFNYETY